MAGLLLENNKLLLIKVHSPISHRRIWMPPGGGVRFGESMEAALKREFLEETGLQVHVGKLRHIHELLEEGFHAIEFFFEVVKTGGELKLGYDPEHAPENQIIEELRYFEKKELAEIPIAPAFIGQDYWAGLTSSSFVDASA